MWETMIQIHHQDVPAGQVVLKCIHHQDVPAGQVVLKCIHHQDIPAGQVVLKCIQSQTPSSALEQDIRTIHIYSSEIIQQSAVDKSVIGPPKMLKDYGSIYFFFTLISVNLFCFIFSISFLLLLLFALCKNKALSILAMMKDVALYSVTFFYLF